MAVLGLLAVVAASFVAAPSGAQDGDASLDGIDTAGVSGSIIIVDTAADRTDPDLCSLRDAVTAANTNTAFGGCNAGTPAPAVDLIITFRRNNLSQGPIGDDTNTTGDIDITESVIIDGGPLGATVTQTLGNPDTDGDGDRVFDIDPDTNDDVHVTFRNLTITGGDLGCNTATICNFGASGIHQHGNGDLTLERVDLTGNHASCTQAPCDADGALLFAALATLESGDLTISHSHIDDNHLYCESPGCTDDSSRMSNSRMILRMGTDGTDGEFTMLHTTFNQNTLTCTGTGCDVNEGIELAASVVLVEHSTFNDNLIRCTGDNCQTTELIEPGVDGQFDRVFRHVEFVGNIQDCSGFACEVDELVDGSGGDGFALMEDVLFQSNRLSCTGEECDTNEIIDSFDMTGPNTLDRVTFRDNVLTCAGTNCNTDEVVDGSLGSDVLTLFRDVLFVGNRLICHGDGCETDEILDSTETFRQRLERVTFIGNVQSCVGDLAVDPDNAPNRIPCVTAEVIDSTGADEDLELIDVRVLFNHGSCEGTLCRADEILDSFGGDLSTTVRNLVVIGNTRTCTGDFCNTRDLWDADRGSPITVDRAVIAANTIRGPGAGHVPDRECAWDDVEGEIVCLPDSARIPALVQFGGATGEFTDLFIVGNSYDGAVPILNTGGIATFRDVVISRNSESAEGGGILSNALGEGSSDPEPTTTDIIGGRITFSSTSGDGGAIHNTAGSTLTLDGTIVAFNRAGGTGGGVFNDGTFTRIGSPIFGNLPNNCVGTGC